ncbi:MAG: PKD domain-containing protein [Candidatus Cloacimonas sp.]|nr:PKD domain-containing protein [Candidatus Cloacimonadota bacterium]
MKKLLLVALLFLMTSSFVFATQRYVIGEVFTATTCGYCPQARSALNRLDGNKTNYPYFIPLVWQYDGRYASPGVSQRAALYSVGGIPHAQFGGTVPVVGGGSSVYQSYVNAYNQEKGKEAPMEIRVLASFDDQSHFTATAEITLTDAITTSSNALMFALTYDLSGTMDPDYFASVLSYSQETFSLNQPGQTTTVTKRYEMGPEIDVSKLRIVVFVQTLTGTRHIHQAGIGKLESLAPNFTSNIVKGPSSLAVQFYDESISTSEIISWEWDFDGDGIVDSNEQNPSHVYTEEGVYNVTLKVSTDLYEEELTRQNYITVTDTKNISGKVGGTWHVENSPYYVTDDMTIPEDSYLVIEPGVEIISDGAEIVVLGSLVADATDEEQIVFTSEDSWKGLRLNGHNHNNVLHNVYFTKASDTALMVNSSSVSLIGSTFYKNTGSSNPGAVGIISSNDVVFKNNTLANNESTRGCGAFEVSASSFSVVNSLFVNNTGFLSSSVGMKAGAEINFLNNTIANNARSAESAFHVFNFNSYVVFRNSIIRGDDKILSGFANAVTQVERTNITGWFTGPDNIDEDPMFVQPTEGDGIEFDGLEAIWYLQPNSPCVDGGNPHPAQNDPEDPNNPGYARFPARGTVRNDMGAFGGFAADFWVSTDDIEFIVPAAERSIIAYPNPFNPNVLISLDKMNILENESINLKIYNTKGQLVKTIVDNERISNSKVYSWNGVDDNQKEAPSGVYFIRLTSKDTQRAKKIILLK